VIQSLWTWRGDGFVSHAEDAKAAKVRRGLSYAELFERVFVYANDVA